ncbi:MAG TPA: Nif3-like dinuclear metal center hexameric protein [Accumulibacter sp.]|nr:Nif3-like dinuclear metal center hexameric protein [Accumulibacter sp.]HMW17264.1 Nif3-like dinuclear metal center hexameric protein [Accumulibacter sp.]HMX21600.1 Nif3-like dinuclear metal center hexameric protein [Accumulibacter sp.]HMY05582.1 Nif3-like dinuclear metal center hexameric protein [Accumulibacter sp.]HNC17842.1 Nif3-like dinuclear metal center hexameric protein [Accumulibacter sp.]
MKREELILYLDTLLEAGRCRDYCPNGLQVEGSPEIRHLIAGVSASQALIDAAITAGADTLLVHHGWFWRGEDGRVIGIRKRRLQSLLANEINLIAYHLPLDGHVEFGNNAQLAKRFGWLPERRFGEQDLGWLGRPTIPCSVAELARQVTDELQRPPLLVGPADRRVERVAWCSGAAQGLFEQAIALGADVYLSGEVSEPTVHLARESGVAYLAAGHHATERYGVQALATHLIERFDLDGQFLDLDNPV